MPMVRGVAAARSVQNLPDGLQEFASDAFGVVVSLVEFAIVGDRRMVVGITARLHVKELVPCSVESGDYSGLPVIEHVSHLGQVQAGVRVN